MKNLLVIISLFMSCYALSACTQSSSTTQKKGCGCCENCLTEKALESCGCCMDCGK